MNAQTSISGNLSGRTPQVAEEQQMDPFVRGLDKQTEDLIIKALISVACEGNVNAAKLLFERKYGKVPAKVEDKTDTVIRVEYA